MWTSIVHNNVREHSLSHSFRPCIYRKTYFCLSLRPPRPQWPEGPQQRRSPGSCTGQRPCSQWPRAFSPAGCRSPALSRCPGRWQSSPASQTWAGSGGRWRPSAAAAPHTPPSPQRWTPPRCPSSRCPPGPGPRPGPLPLAGP
eukprot:1190128-Prorocentrum_minimum.AAC.1